ncbi:hypothetical protein Fot_22877 [Forsythia ovata]|uniref:Uncharacterized protein n=1 Tax=Forsythia ovata TaxID=205694 RepID=A0ABD1UYZ4_9LAMI
MAAAVWGFESCLCYGFGSFDNYEKGSTQLDLCLMKKIMRWKMANKEGLLERVIQLIWKTKHNVKVKRLKSNDSLHWVCGRYFNKIVPMTEKEWGTMRSYAPIRKEVTFLSNLIAAPNARNV